MRKLLILALVLMTVTACPVTQTEQAKVTRVEITPGTVLLTASGQTKTLTAQAFDQFDKPMNTTFTWVSSKPETVSVNASGAIQANTALGSSQITASSNGVQSPAIVAAIVEPADGAVLVSDNQVVVDPVMLDPTLGNALGAKLKVTLRDTPNLAVGNLVIPTENKAFAGRVVSSTDIGGGQLEVVLEQVAIPTLLKRYSINSVYEVNTPSTIQFSGAPTPLTNSRNVDENTFKLGPFKCKATIVASLLNANLEVKVEPHLQIKHIFETDVKQFSVTGTVDSKVTGKLVFGANITGTVTCKYEVERIKIPIGGVLAYFAGLQVPVGHKFQLKLSLQSPQIELAVEFKNKSSVTLGFAWSKANGWSDLRDFNSDTKIKPRFNYPTSLKNFRAEVSLGMYGYAGLDAGSPALDFIGLTSPFSILELNLGIRADVKLGGVQTQVDDSGYNSKYELKAVLEAGLGSNAKKLAEDIVAWTSDPDANGSSGVLQLKTTASLETTLTRSAFGTDTVDKEQVSAGDKVKFSVKLDPDSTRLTIPPNNYYNVKTIDFYRVRDGKDAEMIKSLDASDGQTNFDWEWTPTKADVGENKFYAFVVSKELFDTTPLEIKEESKLTVNVSGDSFVTIGIVGSKTESYSSPATGSRSTSINMSWRFDPSDKPSIIQAPGIIFGQPVPGYGTYYLKPSLSGIINDKDDYKLDEACICEKGRDVQSSSFEFISSQNDVPTDLNIPTVNVQMQGDGNYTMSILIPNASVKGDFSSTKMQNEGCPSDGPRTPVNDSFNGRLETIPYVTIGELKGKIDLSKDTILQGFATFQKDATGNYTRIDTSTPFNGSWSVPSTITVNWKLSFAASTKSSSLKPPPFNTNVLPAFLNESVNSDVKPWGGMNRALETKRKPRC
jgi:hypothetical protein